MKKKKYVVWGLAVCLIVQVVIAGIAMAASPSTNDLTGHTEYLIVHGTTDPTHLYDSLGGTSTVTVKRPDKTTITPTGGVYTSIPNGSDLEMVYAFHLIDGDGSEFYDYSSANYFDISLPVDITLSGTIGTPHEVYADPGPSQWLLGSWSLVDTHTIRFRFSDYMAGHHAVWGSFGFNGTFDNINYGDETERTLTLGADSIVFRRQPPDPPHFTLEKTGAYNAAENTIEWTVTVTPPDDKFLMDGYEIVDDFSNNQSYVDGSFGVTGSTFDAAGLSLDAPNHTVTYTFPNASVKGVQVIKYKTSPLSFSTEDGTSTANDQSTFTNAATVKKGTETAIGPVTATVQTNWITKTAPNDSDPNVIRWEVTAAVPNNGSVTGAYIHDILPIGMILDTGHPVQISLNGGALTTVESTTTNEWGKYAYTVGTFGSSGTSGTLDYRFPSGGALTGTARLVYYTKVGDPNYYINNNAAVNFRNTAQLEWTQKPTSTDPPKDYVDGNIPGSGLISKTAVGGTQNYNHNNHGIIHWTITVNRNKVTMPGASITDTIPAGQELQIDADGHPFTVSNGVTETISTTVPYADTNLTVTDSNHFTYTFPTSFTDTYTIDYYTHIIDTDPGAKNDSSGLDTLYANGNVNFGNGVLLHRDLLADVPGGTNKTFGSQMINKGVGTYNYSDHTIKWTVSVNRNRLPLTNATMTDLLPTGMDLLVDATHPFEVSVNGVLNTSVHAPSEIATDGRSFIYRFGAATTTDQYTISFYTHLQNAQLEAQWSGTKPYTNTSQLRGDEIFDHIDASATANIANPVISKGRTYTAGSDSIDWSIVINACKIPLLNAVVTDQLDPGLQLQSSSLKLYEVAIDTSGNVQPASSGTLVTSGYTVDLPDADNSNTLSVNLPEGSTKVYRLEFTTFIISDDLNFTNNAVLSGRTDSPDGDADAQNVSVDNLWSSGGSGSYTLTVYKGDGKGNPVPGSIYQLLNFNQQPILKNGNPVTATTDSHGNAVFTNLPAWVFYAKEIYAPDGFLLNPDIFGGERLSTNKTFTTADAAALGTVSFNKVNHKGAALSGGEFTLTGEAYDNTDVSMTASSVNGKVTFSNLPIGTYTIRETRAPAGYVVSDKVLTVTVEYADVSRLGVKSTVSANQIVDQPVLWEHFGSIRLMKTNENGKPLAGAEFGLYNADGALVKSAVSLKDGTVLFEKVQFGKYTIREIKAPKGYMVSADVKTVTIDEDDVIIEAGSFVNARDTGSPDTGDNIMGYFVMALGSMAGIVVVYVINKRIKKVR